MIRSFFTKVRLPIWTIPLALLGLCAASFGLLAPWLGFYWDDWTQLLVNRLYGPSAYWPYFAIDRPTSAWTHVFFAPLLGGSPVYWQILTLGLRGLAVIGMWWTFSTLWPHARRPVTLAAFLFAVYPSFTQQSIAVSYHQHFTQYALFFLSLGAMLQAQRSPRRYWLWTLVSLTSLLGHLSITEFFSGIELLRPLLIWFVLGERIVAPRRRALQSLIHAAPYLAVNLAYIIWRLFVHQFPGGNDMHPPEMISLLTTAPLSALLTLARFAGVDILYTMLTSWGAVLDIRLTDANQPVVLASWLLTLSLALGLSLYLTRLDLPEEMGSSKRRRTWLKQAFILGALVVILGQAPIWATGGQMVGADDVHTNRFSLVAMFGASLIYAAVLEWGLKDWHRKSIFLAMLVGLAAGFHLRTANDYRWIWTQQQRFYRQLSWRAPAIKAPTALVAEQIFLLDQELVSTASALNLLYPQPPENDPRNMPMWLFRLLPRYDNGIPETESIGFHTYHRIFEFSAATPDSLLIQFNPDIASCLWVLKPEDIGHPDLSPIMEEALFIANPDRILNNSPVEGYPPPDLFGPEPEHGWCYLFQKADLARQTGDWQTAAALGDEARQRGFTPYDSPSNTPYEWLPFIEGYARTERWGRAFDVTVENTERDPDYIPMLCNLWQRLNQDTPANPDKSEAVASTRGLLNCDW